MKKLKKFLNAHKAQSVKDSIAAEMLLGDDITYCVSVCEDRSCRRNSFYMPVGVPISIALMDFFTDGVCENKLEREVAQ